MTKTQRNLIIGGGAVGTGILIWWLCRRKKQQQEQEQVIDQYWDGDQYPLPGELSQSTLSVQPGTRVAMFAGPSVCPAGTYWSAAQGQCLPMVY